MVVIRQKIFNEQQKDFSYTSARRLVRAKTAMKGVGNKIMTAVDNAGLKTGNAVKEIVTGKITPEHQKVKFVPKTKEQLTKEAIGSARKLSARSRKQAATNIKVKAIDAANKVYFTPGQTVDSGVKFAAENPIAATGNAASVVLPAVNPVWAAIPVGGPSFAIEAGAKKVPVYKKGTKKLGELWSNSSISKGLKSMGSLPETAGRMSSMIAL